MTGCHSDPDVAASKSATAPASPDRSKLQPVALPNLSRSDPSVQKQLREGYAALTAKMADPNATDVELGFAYGDMGKLLLAAEFRDAAEPNFLNAQTLTPNEVRWPYYLGHLYKVKGDSSRASASFERALQLQPDDLATLVWLGNIYLDQGRFPEAQPLFERAFAIQPRSPAVLFGMGRAALARQEYAKTVEYLEQVLSLDPNAIVVHYPLAMAYRGLGDIQKAEAHLQARGPGEVRPPDPLMKQIETLLESAVA
jgi:tetratricopeptide (TPR) repeat protein